MNKLNNILIATITLASFFCFGQNIEEQAQLDFYVVDTVTIANAVVFYKPNQSGKFISSLELIKAKDFKLKKAINNEQLFIYAEDLYRFLDTSKINNYHYPDYGNCQFDSTYSKEVKDIDYQKFKKQPKKFVLGLINTAYYNKKVQVYGKKSTIFKRYGNATYYKIVFPLCE